MLKQASLTLACLLLWCGSARGVSLTVSSTVGGAGKPFTVGHAFARGDVPAGSSIVSSQLGANFQAVIKNAWPDGSAKFAVLSGLAPLTANTALSIGLALGAASGGAALTTANLQATGIVAMISGNAFGTATWQGNDWAAPFAQWIAGPIMSSWTYRKPIGSDRHLVAWMEVRLYSNGAVEVLPWIENGYLNVSGPTSKSSTWTFTLGGTQRFSGSITFPPHTRAVLANGATFSHWLGTDPAVTPKHDTAYLQATKLVPTYFAVTASNSPIWTTSAIRGNAWGFGQQGLAQTYTPLNQGDFSASMPAPGYQSAIGPLPEWDVAYLTSSGDARALAAIQVNAYGAGRFATHFRDETTNRPLRFSTPAYADLVMDGSEAFNHTGTSSTGHTTPPATGGGTCPNLGPGQDCLWDIAHSPSVGYMAYLLLGRYYFLEETQFVVTANWLAQNDTTRRGGQGILETTTGTETTRGAAWALRSLGQAATITPDDDGLRTELINSIQNNISYYYGRYITIPGMPQGIAEPYQDYGDRPGRYSSTMWMEHWFSWVFLYINELELVDAPTQSTLTAFLAWKVPSIVNFFGGGTPTEWCYRDAVTSYTTAMAPCANPDWAGGTGCSTTPRWWPSFGAMYLDTFGLGSNTCNSSTALNGSASSDPRDPVGYWGNIFPAISYAVQYGAPGALAGYNRMIGASNWNTINQPVCTQFGPGNCYNDNPVWSVVPRRVGGATPNSPSNLTLR